MTDTPASGPAETPPADRRPRPQFGELAPEGWTWEPPVTPAAGGAPPPAEAAPAIEPAIEPAGRTVPGWDRPVTLSLLIFGLMATLTTIAMFIGIPDALQSVYTQQGLGTYEPAASVPGLLLAGSVSAGLLWALTLTAAIMLLVRARRAFYVPIIGGVLGVIVTLAVMAVILATDPTLLNFYGQG
ncbi:MAG: DUF6264 family protein [Cryobacterium sp.]